MSVTNQPATNQAVRVPDVPKLRAPEILSKQFLQRLKDELHLTVDENDTIQKIIAEGQNQIRKTIQDSRLEIRDVLTPDQQKQFDELMRRPFRKAIFNTNAPTVFSSTTNSTATNSPWRFEFQSASITELIFFRNSLFTALAERFASTMSKP